jgi:hypothetical protein
MVIRSCNPKLASSKDSKQYCLLVPLPSISITRVSDTDDAWLSTVGRDRNSPKPFSLGSSFCSICWKIGRVPGRVSPVRRHRASPAEQGEHKEYIDVLSLHRQSLQFKQFSIFLHLNQVIPNRRPGLQSKHRPSDKY